jgi:hypothetical protein
MAPFPDDPRSTDQAHPALIANEDDRPMGPVTNETPPAAANTADRLDPALLKLAGIVLVGAVAVQLDATIVSVAINTLGRDLHAGLSSIQWVSTGYLLALAVVIPLTGWSVDRFGSKRMWMLSLALFLRRLGALRLSLVGRQPDRLSRRARPDRARRYGARHYRHDPLHPSGVQHKRARARRRARDSGRRTRCAVRPGHHRRLLRPAQRAIPRATSTVRIFQQVGGSFGTALLAVILQHQTAHVAGAGPAELATAFGHTFWWAVGFTALALIPALLLPRGRPQAGVPGRCRGTTLVHHDERCGQCTSPR